MAEQVWLIDDGSIRQSVENLQKRFEAIFGHLDMSKIMFVRMVGGASLKWAGKCFHVRPPWNLLAQAPSTVGMQVPEGLDIRFIIALNDDQVRGIFIHEETEAMVLFHELLHINREMDGLRPHDVEDFSFMLHEFGLDYTTSENEEVRKRFEGIMVKALSEPAESSPEGMA